MAKNFVLLVHLFLCSLTPSAITFPNGSCSFWIDFSVSSNTLGNHEPAQPSGCYHNKTTSTESYNCSSLQDALKIIDELSHSDCVQIELHSGKHLITRPINTTASFRMRSFERNKTVVYCDFNAEELYYQTGGVHTLYFNRSNLVVFSNVQFEACPLPIRVDRSGVVLVENSSFRYFTEAVFDIHNSINVTVHNCDFINNYGSGIINEPYRGNTGGLSITYNYMDASASNPFVTISNSSFTNNSAIPSKNFLTSDQTFASGVLIGRGGGMAVFVREDYFNVSAKIFGCYFGNNFVRSYGGAMYILFNGGGSHATYIEGNIYESNVAMVGGAAVTLVGVRRAKFGPHSFTVKQCIFNRNLAAIGAGVYYSINLGGGTTNVIHIEDSSFIENSLSGESESFGAAIAVDIAEDFSGDDTVHINTLRNCLFNANDGRNSIVSIGFQTFNLSGYNRFIENKGPALRIVGATVMLSDRIEFIGNTAVEGAAMLLLSFSQALLVDNLQLLFHSNIGRFGSSLFVSSVPSAGTFEHLLHNPQCFLILESDAQLPPTKWSKTGINITFTNNSAWFGAAIYATSLTSCSWVSTDIHRSFDPFYFPNWPVLHIREDNYNRAFSEPYNQIHSVVTNSINLDIFSSLEIKGWPGQRLNFSLQARDEFGNPTGSLLRLLFTSKQLPNMVTIEPNTLLVSNEKIFVNLTFDVDKNLYENQSEDIGGDIIINHFGVFLSTEESESESVHLTGESCLGGYMLGMEEINGVSPNSICECDNEDENILLCEENQDSIIIRDGLWAAKSSTLSGNLFFLLCPFGYCRCFLNSSLGADSCVNVYTNSEPDRQCVCGRKGILCGECEGKAGLTVLFNQCSLCNPGTVSLIPLLTIISIVIMLIIVLLDVPLPQWTYPLLFYIQIAPLVSLHFPLTFNTTGKYLIYLASGLSFYFPYDFCIHDGMTALESYGLKFIPGITALVVIPVAVLVRYILSKFFSSMDLQSFGGHGIWTILLLISTHTMYAATTILNCPVIPNTNGTSDFRWYIDGSVKCFMGGHLPLLLFAIFWIILLTLLLTSVLSLPYTYKKFKKHVVLKQLKSSLEVPFKRLACFWSGLDLFRRFFIVILVTAYPDNSAYVFLFLMLLIALYGHNMPYKRNIINIQEMLSLISFLVLLLLRANLFLQDVLEITVENNMTSIPSCNGKETNVTKFALVLTFLYYTPISFGIVSFWIWIGPIIKQYHKKFQSCRKVERSADGFEVGKSDIYNLTNHHNTSGSFLTVKSTELTIPLL